MPSITLSDGQVYAAADPILEISVEPRASATLIHRIDDGEAVNLAVTVPAGSELTVIALQLGDSLVDIKQRATVQQGGAVHWRNVTLGSGTVNHDLVSTLTGDHAQSSVDWLFYAKGEEHYRLSARNEFAGRDGGGEMLLKGVAEDCAHVSCDGMIAIGSGGSGTDTYLTEEMLMLDPTAQVNAVPGLEIKTNDVKASHSATVSRVTPADLFYFAARGIDTPAARRMYIEGFLGGLTEGMPGEVREEVLQQIDQKYLQQ